MKNKGFTLLELLIVVVILGILSLIATTILMDAADKAKDAAIKANLNAGGSTVLTQMTVEDKTPAEAVEASVENLNNPDNEDGSGDEVKSPYDTTLDAFVNGDTGGKGQVALDGTGDTFVKLRGFGKRGSDADPIVVKTINKPGE